MELAVWQPTERSLALAERLKEKHALDVYAGHRRWRAQFARGERPPHVFRGDVGIDWIGDSPLGGHITLINGLGEVSWHDDRGAAQWPHSYFLILRNKKYVVRQEGEPAIPEQGFGSLVRCNTDLKHALLAKKPAPFIEHGLWLAVFFELPEIVDDPEFIMDVFEEGLC